MDTSTLNYAQMERLPVLNAARVRHLQKTPGNACYLDAPGYPTYFTRSVYNAHGNSPMHGPQMVLDFAGRYYVVEHSDDHRAGEAWDAYRARKDALLHSLWVPLPYGHPRVQAWIREVYRHMAHCYVDEAQLATPFEYGKPRTLIYPVPSYKLETFRDDPKGSADWREKAKAAVAARNADIEARAAQVAVPENHLAYRLIHKFYPEHTPDLELIQHPPATVGGFWWETDAERPTPETCHPRGSKHPVNGTWCQWCGYEKTDSGWIAR